MTDYAPEPPAGQGEEVPAEVDAGIDSTVELAELRSKLEAAESRASFLEQQVVAKSKRGWVEEQARAHPELVALLGKEGLAGIEATSRRGFERKAAQLAELHAPSIEQLRSLKEQASASVEALREQAVQDARAEVAAAWGKPAGDFAGSSRLEPEDPKATLIRKLAQ
jgi:hypothetical protein